MSVCRRCRIRNLVHGREIVLTISAGVVGAIVGGLLALDLLRCAGLMVLAGLALWVAIKLLKLNLPAIIATVLVLALLAPPYRFSEFPDVRPEQLVVFAFPVLIFMHTVARGKELSKPILSKVDVLFLAYAACILVSILLGYLLLDVPLSYHDFIEFGKIGLYYLAFRIGMSVEWREPGARAYAIVVLAAVLVLAVIAISQAYNLLGVNDYLSPLYIKREFILSVVRRTRSFRVVGTVGNPNHFGFMETMVVSFLLSIILFCQRKLSKIALIVLLAAVASSLFCIFLTASRTATLAMAASAGFILLAFVTSSRTANFPRRVLSVALALAVPFVVLPFAHGRFFEAMKDFMNLSGITQLSTIEARFAVWRTVIEQIRMSPVFGWGLATGSMTGAVDSDYLLLTRQFGIAGLALLVLLFTYLFRSARQVASRGSNPLPLAYGRAVQGILVGLAFYSVTAGAFENQQLMVIFWLLAGGLCAFASKHSRDGDTPASP